MDKEKRRGTRAKRAYHHGDLRKTLIASTTRLLDRVGVDALSLREVARETGVSPSAAYNHFEDKAALLTAVAAEGFDELTRAIERERETHAGASATARRQRLLAMGRAYVTFALGHRAHFMLMFGSDRSARRLVESSARGSFDLLVAELAPMPLRGSPRDAALALWAAVHGIAGLLADGAASGESVDATVGRVAAAMLDGVLRPPARIRGENGAATR